MYRSREHIFCGHILIFFPVASKTIWKCLTFAQPRTGVYRCFSHLYCVSQTDIIVILKTALVLHSFTRKFGFKCGPNDCLHTTIHKTNNFSIGPSELTAQYFLPKQNTQFGCSFEKKKKNHRAKENFTFWNTKYIMGKKAEIHTFFNMWQIKINAYVFKHKDSSSMTA